MATDETVPRQGSPRSAARTAAIALSIHAFTAGKPRWAKAWALPAVVFLAPTNIFNDIAERSETAGSIIGDFNVEFFLELHDQLDAVERIERAFESKLPPLGQTASPG